MGIFVQLSGIFFLKFGKDQIQDGELGHKHCYQEIDYLKNYLSKLVHISDLLPQSPCLQHI